MDHEQAQDSFSDYVDGSLAGAAAGRGRPAPGGVHPVPDRADGVSRDGRLAGAAQAGRRRPSFLPDIKQQIYKRSRGRFFGPRWKLFGRIPFEWVSLATIIAMLVYYIAMMHGSPERRPPDALTRRQLFNAARRRVRAPLGHAIPRACDAAERGHVALPLVVG